MNIKLSVNLESTLSSLTEKWMRRRAPSPSSGQQTTHVAVNDVATGRARSYVQQVPSNIYSVAWNERLSTRAN